VAKAEPEFGTDPGPEFGDPIDVSVQMADGSVHRGRILLEKISAHARVLDLLNRTDESFLQLHHDGGSVTLLNRAHIAYVHPFDDGTS
jgi:hypothetical protein